MPDLPRLAIFARAARRGAVKRRLAAEVGDDIALDVHLQLLQATLTVLAPGSGGFAPELWLEGEGDLPPSATALPQRQQPPGDLGAKMLAAFEDGVTALVGSDIPPLTAAHVHAALARLAWADVVLTPAEDGGYCMIGMNAPLPEMFREVLGYIDRDGRNAGADGRTADRVNGNAVGRGHRQRPSTLAGVDEGRAFVGRQSAFPSADRRSSFSCKARSGHLAPHLSEGDACVAPTVRCMSNALP